MDDAASSSASEDKPRKVERVVVAPRFFCGLCRGLVRDATTIIECLHSFCRKCIYKKLNDDEEDCFECPVCHTHLGALPVEKLRADHNLQELRIKLFPRKKKKLEISEIVQPVPLPVKRKERSLSSLVVDTDSPQESIQTGLTARQTKSVKRRSATGHGHSPAANVLNKKEVDNFDKLVDTSNLADSKQTVNRRQSPSGAEQSNNAYKKDAGGDGNVNPDTAELWNCLNCLVEVANKTKSFKSTQRSPLLKTEHSNGHCTERSSGKNKVKNHPQTSKVLGEKITRIQTTPTRVKKLNGTNRKRKDPEISSLLEAANALEKRVVPIWFTLIASSNQSGSPTLPQVPTRYLRIRDYNMPASFIQKYLANKFGLASETEVEISCRGELVNPMATLQNLTEQWIKVGSSQKMQAVFGASGKDFVMVLSYGRSKVSSQ